MNKHFELLNECDSEKEQKEILDSQPSEIIIKTKSGPVTYRMTLATTKTIKKKLYVSIHFCEEKHYQEQLAKLHAI